MVSASGSVVRIWAADAEAMFEAELCLDWDAQSQELRLRDAKNPRYEGGDALITYQNDHLRV